MEYIKSHCRRDPAHSFHEPEKAGQSLLLLEHRVQDALHVAPARRERVELWEGGATPDELMIRLEAQFLKTPQRRDHQVLRERTKHFTSRCFPVVAGEVLVHSKPLRFAVAFHDLDLATCSLAHKATVLALNSRRTTGERGDGLNHTVQIALLDRKSVV